MCHNLRVFLLRLLASLLFSCSLTASAAMDDALLVGVSADYRPLVFKREGKLVGVEIDNAHEIGAALGRPVRFIELPFGELLAALNSGAVDVVMSGLSVTEARQRDVAFTKPFMRVGQMAIIRADDIPTLGLPRAIHRPGVTVGVEKGTTGEQFARTSMPGLAVRSFTNTDAALEALRSGDIDVFIHDAPTSWNIAAEDGQSDLFSLFRLLTEEELAWAVRKSDTDLLGTLNHVRDELLQSGRLQAIQSYWIPVKIEVQ